MPTRSRARGLEPTAANVLRYFLRHPRAVDTLEGIAHWRILEQVVARELRGTDLALRWLVKQGVLRVETRRGVPPLFRLDTRRRSTALRLLCELERGAHER